MKHLTLKILLIICALTGILPLNAQGTNENTFPITVEHKFGSTTITQAPEHIISIGFTDLDPLLALDAKPIAVRYWYGDTSNAIFPWAQGQAEDTNPTILDMAFGNLNYEAILALQPDLIVAVYSGITQEEYDTLSQIAPTIVQSADYTDFGMPWQETTQVIGTALGQADQADALITALETKFDTMRSENPQFVGKSIAVAYSYSAGAYGFYTAQDPRARFFTDLGFIVPDELIEIADDSFYADLSPERIDLLDRDLLVVVGLQFVEGGREEIENDPLLRQLDVVKQGRVLYVANDVDDALQFSTILSLGYALDGILPQLTAIFQPETDNNCELGFHTMTHSMGTSCVPENPIRIVALDTGELDNALALGATVIGAPIGDTLQYQAYLSDQLDGISDTGTISEPNLEAILALNPDLILGSKQRYEAIYEQLSQIAPTVLSESLRVPWQDNFSFHAMALGKTVEAEQLLADYSAHVADLQVVLGDTLDSTSISIIRFRPGQVRLYLKSSFIGYILQDIGLNRPLSQDVDSFSSEISLEQVQDVDADYIFITGYAADDSDQDTFLESPPWQTLGAVQNDHAIDVNDDTWIAGLGVQAANYVLDDLESFLASS